MSSFILFLSMNLAVSRSMFNIATFDNLFCFREREKKKKKERKKKNSKSEEEKTIKTNNLK